MLVVGSAAADNDLLGGNVQSAQLCLPAGQEGVVHGTDNTIYCTAACGVAGIEAAIDYYGFLDSDHAANVEQRPVGGSSPIASSAASKESDA